MFLPADKSDEVDLRKTYDAIVVGSGAAGGMAAHVLTSHGMQVLLLEAGKKRLRHDIPSGTPGPKLPLRRRLSGKKK